ncbi:MAG: hypothetical protein LC740_05855, partial [Actinobacteria bacterium]|nr:hypothetical protein [Actinomycetota bacterium]
MGNLDNLPYLLGSQLAAHPHRKLGRTDDVDIVDVDTSRSADDCDIDGDDEVKCDLDTIEGGRSAKITIVVEPTDNGNIINTATLLYQGEEIARDREPSLVQ